MNIIEARTYDIDGNLVEVLTGKDARAIAEVPPLLELANMVLELATIETPKALLDAASAILKRIEG